MQLEERRDGENLRDDVITQSKQVFAGSMMFAREL